MSDSLLDTAIDVFPRMLEDAAFLFSDDTGEELEFGSPFLGVGIAYDGAESGELRLWAETGLANILAANMLGIDESDELAGRRRADALGELLNMVLGHCLTEHYGDDESMRMGLPHELAPEVLAQDRAGGHWISVEGHPVLLGWREIR